MQAHVRMAEIVGEGYALHSRHGQAEVRGGVLQGWRRVV